MSLNYTRLLEIHEKKSECFMSGIIVGKNGDADTSIGEIDINDTEDYLLGNIPRDAFITNAYLFVQDSLGALTAQLGTTQGGNDLVAAVSGLTTGGKPGEIVDASNYIDTGTGTELWLRIGTNIAAAAGEFVFVVEYEEHKLNTGKLTRITQRPT